MKCDSVDKSSSSPLAAPAAALKREFSTEYRGTEENKESPVSSSSSSSIDLLVASGSDGREGCAEAAAQTLPSSLQHFGPAEVSWPCKIETISTVSDSKSSPLFLPSLSSNPVEWSHYDGLNFNNEKFPPSSFGQPPSYTGFEYTGLDQPALTTTPTTGDLSEIDDLACGINQKTGILNRFNHHHYSSDHDSSDFSGEVDTFHISSASSYMHIPQTQLSTSNSYFDDLDAFLKYSNTLSSHSHGPPTRAEEETGKTNQDSSPCNDDSLAFFPKKEENEILWMSNISPSNNTIGCSTQNDLSEEFWVQ